MKPRPTIFLSGVSHEFASFRDAVEIEIQKKGCFVENQPSFATDYRTIEAMLRQKLSEADAVIHIVGFRYGAEPQQRPADKLRRSYTQMEFDIARELNKPVYVFTSQDITVRDPPKAEEKPEDAEVASLQLAHRAAVQSTDNLFYVFKDKDELCRLAAAIPAVASVDFRVDISRIDRYAPAKLIGRDDELALLNDAWMKVRRAETPRTYVLTFVALGGEGKTSLVAKWVADLAHQGWPGCDAAFAWSFYSQGTRDQFAGSSDLFLKEAITFFGDAADKEFAGSSAGAYEKGQRLARIVGQRHSLLILDGLEPLQYAPTSKTPGELKDAGIAALLKNLAVHSNGLCIVTTRYSLPNLRAFWQTTAPEKFLSRLSLKAGVHLLKTLEVTGSISEFEKLVERVKGHALTLNLLGTYLRDAQGGDIRRHDLIRLDAANAEEQGGHAFRVMEAYECAFENEGAKGVRALAILRLLGLFDRPMSAACLAALLANPVITGLTEPLVDLNEDQRNIAFKRLEQARLLTINREASGELVSVDAHPLLREYFARQLREKQNETWRKAHRRVYEHLCATTPDKLQPTLEDLEPLYQAVAHGCQAELQQTAFKETYWLRIQRRRQYYPAKQLGAIGVELGCISAFFTAPWSILKDQLSPHASYQILDAATEYLHSLGRLREAFDVAKLLREKSLNANRLSDAAGGAILLAEISLSSGSIKNAVNHALEAVKLADECGDSFHKKMGHVALAIAYHFQGQFLDARIEFGKAEEIHRQRTPSEHYLLSLPGCDYCELLLDMNAIEETRLRAQACIDKSTAENNLLPRVLAQLVKERCEIAEFQPSDTRINRVDKIIDHLRQIGGFRFVCRAFLVRAKIRSDLGNIPGAQADLDEAWEIAERGPMKLIMADIHLYRARLFFREDKYPWESPRADLESAERLINECGYHRRDEELADAKRVILGIN